ncbi:hypothetical protein LNP25_22845 [Klebsiella variicola subsp. variicola]|nr:hypothetical protein [Klebsiella variicola subsp. variicola]
MHGIRYSHPDTSIIGKRFIGRDILPTLQEERTLPLTTACWPRRCGYSTPVFNDQRQQIGVVVVGISLSKVDEQIANSPLGRTPDNPVPARWSARWAPGPGTRSEARPAGAGAAGDFHPVSTASGHASRPEGASLPSMPTAKSI